MPAPIRHFRAALVFMTRVPVSGVVDDADARSASAYFSWVGTLVGGLAALVLVVLRLGPWVEAGLAVATTMLVTGAMHEDGLADTADALGGSYDRDKLFLILKDPRVGSFGVAALGIVTLLRVAALAEMHDWAVIALVFAHATSRLACTVMLATMPYVTEDAAKSRSVVDARPRHVLVAALPSLAIFAVVAARSRLRFGATFPVAMTAAILASAAVVATLAWRYRVRAGGITGDFLGAAQQLVETTIYVTLSGMLP